MRIKAKNSRNLENHNVAGNGEREGLKISKHEAISSQASSGEVEGSTHRPHGLEQSKKAHECPTTKKRELQRREVTCSICGKEYSLVEKTNNRKDNLTPLCASCHSWIHGNGLKIYAELAGDRKK